MNRQIIREQTMQLIFQMEATNNFDYEKLSLVPENQKVLKEQQAVNTLVAIREHISEIDACISRNLDKWTIDRISKSDLSILRNAVTEMLYCDEIPNNVAISEAVNLAKKFGDDKSYAFVNSILSKIQNETI